MGNGITDELREYVDVWMDTQDELSKAEKAFVAIRLSTIADHIDAAYEKAMSDRIESLTDDMKPMTDENMAEGGWTRLPMDADGEYIHVGDILLGYNDTATVKGLSLSEGGWELICDNGIWHDPEEFVHYHKPTVEEILQEFRDEVALGYVDKEVINEFAGRIRDTLQ